MLGSAPGIAFLPTLDLERSRAFFEGLGLLVEEATPFACVLRAGPTMLRVTRVDGFHPHPFTVFGWQVEDIAATVDELSVLGIGMLRYEGVEQNAAGVWTTPAGDKIAWFKDPDENVLSVTQFTRSQ